MTLVLNEYDGMGNPVVTGAAALMPSTALVNAIDRMDITPWVPLQLFRPSAFPEVKLLATDNVNVIPAGWMWTLAFSGVPGNPVTRSFYLPYAGGSTQYLSSLTIVPYALPIVLTSLDGGSAATGQVPVGNLDGGSA